MRSGMEGRCRPLSTLSSSRRSCRVVSWSWNRAKATLPPTPRSLSLHLWDMKLPRKPESMPVLKKPGNMPSKQLPVSNTSMSKLQRMLTLNPQRLPVLNKDPLIGPRRSAHLHLPIRLLSSTSHRISHRPNRLLGHISTCKVTFLERQSINSVLVPMGTIHSITVFKGQPRTIL